MRASTLALPLVAVLALAGTADAKPKPVTQSYNVVAPVPFPMTTDVPGMYGCIDGEEGLSKNTRRVKLPFNGSLVVQVTYSGDWDLYVLDTKGKMIGAAETTETANTGPAKEKLTVKKATKGSVDIVACNWAGMKDATVKWTLTPR